MPILGAHMSISGGFEKAVERAVAAGCDCLQIFTSAPQRWPVGPAKPARSGKSPSRWKSQPLSEASVEAFRSAYAESGLRAVISHASYLINLAAADDTLWEKSIAALEVELRRADQLGIPHVVLHPGAHTILTEEQGLERVTAALGRIHDRNQDMAASVLLESTAGQGTCLGWRFEHLQRILESATDADRLGVCLDTCHLHAAGYDLTTATSFQRTLREFNRRIGIERLHAIHLNDSKRELGSRVDRHEHIGSGDLGLEPFRRLLNHRRLKKIPMYLETAKGVDEEGEDWDVKNLEVLRSLLST